MLTGALAYVATGFAVLAAGLAGAAFWQSRVTARAVRMSGIASLHTELRSIARQVADRQERIEKAIAALRTPQTPVAAPAGQAEQPRHYSSAPDSNDVLNVEIDAPSANPWDGGIPVELAGRESVRRSASLAPRGYLVEGGATGAELYINPEAAVDHVALREWTRIYEFRGEKPYVRYTTEEPAVIDWNAATDRGQVVRRGIARPLDD